MQEKYKKLLEERGLTTSYVAKETGIPYNTLNDWRKGKTKKISAENLEKLSRFFGVSTHYFMSITDEETKEKINKAYDLYRVSAGTGTLNDDYTETGEPFAESKEYSRVRVVGDSMYPSLHDGDIVLVNHSFEVSDITAKDFVCVKVNGYEDCIKHIEMTDTGIWLRGENPDAYTDTFYSMKDVLTLPVTIIGIATQLIQRNL